MPINITHPIISPPSYVQKTDEGGWYMQIGSRDLMTRATYNDPTDLARPLIPILNNLRSSSPDLFALSYMAFPPEITD